NRAQRVSMKAYIWVDLEGISGIIHSSQTQPGEPGYNRALELMHDETNAVIKGLLDGGVSEIVVNDSHWDMRNLHLEKLHSDKAVFLRSGWQKPFSMVSGLSEADKRPDFTVFLGYHARAGHASGVLSHTYRAQIFFEVLLDGKPVGETGLNAALAGHFGVPVALVTGDNAVCEEARDLLGAVHTCQMKEAVSRYSAVFPDYQSTLSRLRDAACEAAQNKKYWQLFKAASPARIAITMFDPAMADAAELIPNIKRLSSRQIEIEAQDYSQAFRLMLAVGALGASRKDPHFS
ncbi:MAG: M55 family metallopeptidase, partial [Cyanobacteria bacterium SZAS LIN-2]|nr:M55 family metallopeptidase [Cyanobacteria bacterium SZAS LIN-2]